LKKLLEECSEVFSKREMLYQKLMEIDLAGSTREVQYSRLIINYTYLTKEQFEKHVEILKNLSTKKFNSIKEYNEDEIVNWLVSYSNKNECIETSLHRILFDLREFESVMFDIRIKQEINVSPMKYYIQEWLKQDFLKITEEDQLGTV
jgi:hypothetical protein